MQDRMPPLFPEERALLDRAAARECELSHEFLRRVVRDDGIDVATALVYERLRRSETNGPGIREWEQIASLDRQSTTAASGTVALVPGAFHRDAYRQTGANGRVVIEEAGRLGFETAVAPTQSLGSLEANAQILCDWLSQPFTAPVILVSLSKGTAELKVALRSAQARQAFSQVSSWVSLSGIWLGSPLVDWLLARRLRWFFVRLLLRWRGYDFRVIEQLRYGAGGSLEFDVEIPERLHLVHVVGFPLERHLSSPLARRGHRRLAPLGPNDAAGLLLADVGRLPGTVLPIWGADHYLRPAGEDNRELVRRILLWLDRRSLHPTAPLAGSQ